MAEHAEHFDKLKQKEGTVLMKDPDPKDPDPYDDPEYWDAGSEDDYEEMGY